MSGEPINMLVQVYTGVHIYISTYLHVPLYINVYSQPCSGQHNFSSPIKLTIREMIFSHEKR